ncbi:MAG: CHAT domain-containing protein, partial [Roseofilum sp. SID2]|uniref:CHAT domain-containing protein n=2 Tax=unclassified Roseofilum TaxID=2620099 RepID=UPI001AFE1ED6
ERIPSVWNGKQFQARELVERGSLLSDEGNPHAFRLGRMSKGTQLVVLSACDTGLGNISAGEGIYGLRRALAIAGSESQVISLWKVDDAATQELMVDYYENLQNGLGRSDALRAVKLSMLQQEHYQHPYYWASFIPSGNWRPMNHAALGARE